MKIARLIPIALLLGTGAHADGVPNGVRQILKPHVATHHAPVSALAPTLAHPAAMTGLAKAYGGPAIDVTNYHYDDNRTGWNPAETDLTVANVASSSFGLLATLPVDGNVFAQPLLVSNYTMPDGTRHNVLIVATGNNSVYAFDAQNYAKLWQVNLGKQQSSADIGCSDVEHGYGISSTPAIVRSGNSATIYLVAATEPNSFEFHTTLHAIDLGTGADVKAPVEINPSAKLADKSTLHFDPQDQWSRAALAYANGSIYVGISSHCDNNAYAISGWMLRYGTDLSLQTAFNTIKTPRGYELASIWMTGFAPAVDPTGNVFVVTGNGDVGAGSVKDYGESVLKLTPALAVSSHFTPSAFGTLNQYDTDFGSGGVMLLPHVAGAKIDTAVAAGKSGIFYMLNQKSLGGLAVNDHYAIQQLPIDGGVWGGPAYYNGPSGPTVFVQGDGGVLQSFTVPAAKPAFVAAARGTTSAGYGGSLPIVSSNGAAPGTGVVWVVRRSAPIELEAYNAEALGAPIYTAQIGPWSNPADGNAFLTAMQANGRVYVASYLTVKVFGLTQ